MIRKGFEVFKLKFEPFEMDSRHSNVNLNHSKGIRRLRMESLTIPNISKNLNANSNHSKGFEAFKSKFKPFVSKF